MPEFSPKRRAEAPKAKKKPDAPKIDPKNDISKNALIQKLSKTFGNKQMIEMLTRGRFDITKASKEAAGPELMAKFIAPADPIVAEGTRMFMEQLTAYHQFVGAYSDYIDQIRKHSAYGLFWKYQESFQHFGKDVMKNVLMVGIEDLGKLLVEQLPDDDTRNELIKVLQEVHSELRVRENGEDIQKINKSVSSQTDITKTKDGANLENVISSEISLETPPDDYIKAFLKNNNILIEIFEKRVKDEVDKKRGDLLKETAEKTPDVSSDSSTTESSASPIAAAVGGNKP
jgi:hypothetical protein